MTGRAFRAIAALFSLAILVIMVEGCGGDSKPKGPPTITDINGGVSGSGVAGSTFIIDGNNFGNLSAQTSGYEVDFRDASGTVTPATASVNFAGGNWQDIFIVGAVPSLATGAYSVTVTTPAGVSNVVNFQVVASVTFSPSTIMWSATSSLPAAQQGFPTLIAAIGANSYVYALGGNTATGGTTDGKASNVATVSYNQLVDSDGTLANGTWTATSSLPDKRGFAAAVMANGVNSLVTGNGNIYVLGGLDGAGNATSTVYYASLATDGSIPAAGKTGTWTTTTALPQALFAHAAVIFHGRIYVAGGNDVTGAPVAKVYSAKINSDGTLGAWDTTLPDLPIALAYHQLVTAAGYLYVLGGNAAAVDPIVDDSSDPNSQLQANIYYEPINIKTGALANPTWATNLNQMKSREKFTAVVAGGYVLVSGGLYGGGDTSGSNEQAYAQINSDGSIGSFNGATGSQTIYKTPSSNLETFFNHSATFFVDASGNPHVLILGGEDINTGLTHAEVWVQHN